MKTFTDAEYVAAGIGVKVDQDVADALGVTRQAVHVRRKKMGVTAPAPFIWATAINETASLYGAGAMTSVIARARGVSATTVLRHAHAAGVKSHPQRLPTKIDWASIDWNRSSRDIATSSSVSVVSVCRWRTRIGHPAKRTAGIA